MNPSSTTEPSLSPEAARLIDRVCDRFEAAWQQGERPRLEMFVEQVDEPARPALLRQLLPLEWEYRRKAGDTPLLGEYEVRFPEYTSLLREELGNQEGNASSHDLDTPSFFALAQHKADQEEMPVPAPSEMHVPGYEILQELGRGGMGVVYLARQINADRLVALKMILAGGHAGSDELGRFRREGQSLARLRHPHVVQIYEVNEHQGRPFFSMEYCAGGTLQDRLDGTPLPAQEAASLVETLARAVDAAHQANVIHRDLKPGNVLLTEDGTPRISDFGLAKKLDEMGQTQSGAIVGTPSYLSPEQAGDRRQTIGPHTDVYALGAILYECLTGRPPFRAASPVETILQVLADEPVAPRQLQPSTPGDLETICLKCLRKDARQRYPSAGKLAEDLRRFRAGEPIHARPVGMASTLMKWVKRRPASAGLVVAVALLLLVLGVGGPLVALQQAGLRKSADDAKEHADKQAQEASEQRKVAQDNESRAMREKDRADRQLRLTQHHLFLAQLLRVEAIYQTEPARASEMLHDADFFPRHLRGTTWRYYEREVASWMPITIKDAPDAVGSVRFSPDSSKLAVEWGKDIKILDARNRQDLLTLRGHRLPIQDFCFSPDGTMLASGSGEGVFEPGEIMLWDLKTGKEKASWKGHRSTVYAVAFSPDGRTLATGSGEIQASQENDVIKLWDVETQKEKRQIKFGPGGITTLCFSSDGKMLAAGGGYITPGDRRAADNGVTIWDVESGKVLAQLPEHLDMVWSVAFSPDGGTLASAGVYKDRRIRLWDVKAGKELGTLEGHRDAVFSVAFSPDGNTIASGSFDNTVKLWDVKERTLTRLLRAEGGVLEVCFSPDGQWLTAGSRAKTLHFWRMKQAAHAPLTAGNSASIPYDVRISPDNRTLALVRNNREPFSATYKWGDIELWDLKTAKRRATIEAHRYTVHAVAFSPDGMTLASASTQYDAATKTWPGLIKLFDAKTGKERAAWTGHADKVISICFSPDGSTLASGSRDKTIKLWDVQTGKVRLTLEAEWVTSLAFHPDGDRLASGGDTTVRLWDAKTGKLLSTLQGHRSAVHSVSFSPDGNLIASAAGMIHTYGTALDAHKFKGEIKLWDVQTGKAKEVEMEHDLAARAVCFSPDGQALVSGGEDKMIRFWDPKTGQLTATIQGPFHKVVALAFSPNGEALACASTLAPDPHSNQGRGTADREDWEVRVWKFKSNEP